ncbi:hypothetical protein A2164_01715 [Candidatus Curtissbacteria bacterium RBG_13_35_7]|uniref:histidine kinase n=1 Tax=Candidatus Curtissbacteria bacterium RBG_13_35_7 TaxID=1797705 RepID=A0A1F5G064_9BACT|nr:MAG: hypothetical protein A2164_01715 [Candidatus Curtissbacteria bacterium RBG_13_35_7]
MFENPALIFNFAFNPYALLSLTAIVVNLVILVLVQIKGVKNETNYWFSLIPVLVIWWGLSEFLDRSSANATASLFWDFFGRPSYVFLSVTIFSFILSFTGRGEILKSRIYQLLVFGPALLILFLAWNTNLIFNNHIYDNARIFWGWSMDPIGRYFDIFIGWFELFLLGSLLLLMAYYSKVSDKIRKKQTAFFIVGVLIPIIGGSLTDGILPIFGIKVLPIGVLFATGLSVSVSYTIIRSNLFAVNPVLTARTIIDTMSEALVVIGADNVIEQVNKSTLNILGYRTGELYGQNIRKFLPDEESWQKFSKEVLIPLKEQRIVKSFETDFMTKDRRRIPISFSAASLIEAGRLTSIVGLIVDIRETRKLITNILTEKDKMSVVLSGIADGIFALDQKGKIILFNPAMEGMTGFSKEEVIDNNFDELLSFFDKDKRILASSLLPHEGLTGDRVVLNKKNVRVCKKDGTNVFIDLISSIITGGEDVKLGAIIAVHDVTRDHELEEMKLDFISMAAHELRTPLTSIRGYLSVLKEKVKDKISNKELMFLDRTYDSSSRLSALVENLLLVSKIDDGELTVNKTQVNWSELIAEVVLDHQKIANEKEVKLIFIDKGVELPKVYVDSFRIKEAVSKLIRNAIYFTNLGGEIEVSIDVTEAGVVTSIKDSGEGIPKEAMPKLFNKFFRATGALEHGSTKGTGLGLYIAKAIIELHGGQIWARSEVGKGSTFSFNLPVKQEELSANL